MRDFLKSTGRRVRTGWFWPLVLLALPNCFLDGGAYSGASGEFDPGPEPQTSAIMCDIPKVPEPGSSPCASTEDLGSGMSKSLAAVALAQNQHNSLVLDWSTEALNQCNGMPLRTEYQGPFPDGLTVCLNCGTQIPTVYATATKACIAKCTDLVNLSEGPQPPEGAAAFCEANAKVSTNFPLVGCIDDACTSGGSPDMAFFDPRRYQEPVAWTDLFEVDPTGNTLTATIAAPDGNFKSGASADDDHLIKKGDAWVEFQAGENTLSHVLGVSTDTGTDPSASLEDIAFGISLNFDGNVNIVEGGVLTAEGVATYDSTTRFRVYVEDNDDGTATITYKKLIGDCVAGTICNQVQIGAQTAPSPSYPLRIIARFREANASLVNVTMMRIR